MSLSSHFLMWMLSPHRGLAPWEIPPGLFCGFLPASRLEERYPFRKRLLFLSSCRSSFLCYYFKHLHLPHPGEHSVSQVFLNKIGHGVTGRPELRRRTGPRWKCGGPPTSHGAEWYLNPENTHFIMPERLCPTHGQLQSTAPLCHQHLCQLSSSCSGNALASLGGTALQEPPCPGPSWRWVAQSLMLNTGQPPQ